jgi:hypothetical protein
MADAPVDPWRNTFESADHRAGGLEPYWIYAGDARIKRHVPAKPMSIDRYRLVELVRLLGIYRLAFGQPRQEELLAALADPGIDGQTARELVIGLTPA